MFMFSATQIQRADWFNLTFPNMSNVWTETLQNIFQRNLESESGFWCKIVRKKYQIKNLFAVYGLLKVRLQQTPPSLIAPLQSCFVWSATSQHIQQLPPLPWMNQILLGTQTNGCQNFDGVFLHILMHLAESPWQSTLFKESHLLYWWTIQTFRLIVVCLLVFSHHFVSYWSME